MQQTIKSSSHNETEQKVLDVLNIKLTTNLTELSALTNLEEADTAAVIVKLHEQSKIQLLDHNRRTLPLVNLADAFIQRR